MSDDGAIPKIEGPLLKLKGIYIIYVFFNIKRGFIIWGIRVLLSYIKLISVLLQVMGG